MLPINYDKEDTDTKSSKQSIVTAALDFNNTPPNIDVPLSVQQIKTTGENFIAGENIDECTVEDGCDIPRSINPNVDDILQLRPQDIRIVKLEQSDEEYQKDLDAKRAAKAMSRGIYPFVDMFRGAASYIASHRASVVVFHIPGDLLEWEGFTDMINDITLLWLLGMKLVIVAGSTNFIDRRLAEDNSGELPPGSIRHRIRITDSETLRVIKEEAGFVRFEVERQLARALRQGSLNAGGVSLNGNVVSGNFFSAQPFGVVDGVDYQYTGVIRRVEAEKIRAAHASNDVVLLTSLGMSPSGEAFNVNSESLASGVASALNADKIVFFSKYGAILENKKSDEMIMSLRVPELRDFLEFNDVKLQGKGFAMIGSEDKEDNLEPAVNDMLIKLAWSHQVLQNGVKRAHIVPPWNGALLQELYTQDGSGTLINRDVYEGIRHATVEDVAGIYELTEPLVREGILVSRSKNKIEKDVNSYYIYTRDSLVLACAQLKRYESSSEIGCLVVSKKFRGSGKGDAMLAYLERVSLMSGGTSVFVLSTQTMQFFVERGFKKVTVESLPPSRRINYDVKRNSKIYMKKISDQREIDAEELLWDR